MRFIKETGEEKQFIYQVSTKRALVPSGLTVDKSFEVYKYGKNRNDIRIMDLFTTLHVQLRQKERETNSTHIAFQGLENLLLTFFHSKEDSFVIL